MKYIYKITNLINNKIYIGQHNGKRTSYFGSGKLLKYAIKKYGKENFTKDILEEGDFTQNQIDELEKQYIKAYQSNKLDIGYNLEAGGLGGVGKKLSHIVRKKMATSMRGKKKGPRSEEHKEKLRQARLGKKISEETRQKMSMSISKSLLGKKLSDTHKESLRKSHIGYIMPEEQKRKIAKSNTNNPKTSKSILCFTKDRVFIKEYPSISQAARELNISSGNICSCLKGTFKTSKGYIWEYK